LRVDVPLELDLALAYTRDPRQAMAICEAAAERAAAAGDELAEALARVGVALHSADLGRATPDEIEALVLEVLPRLEEAGDDHALAHVWHARAYGVANVRGQWEEMAVAGEQARRHAGAVGMQQQWAVAGGLLLGSAPADEAIARLDASPADAWAPIPLLCRAWLLAMLDRFDEAATLAREQSEQMRERTGDRFGEWYLAEIDVLHDNHAGAARHLSELCAWLEAKDQRALLSTYAPRLGRALCTLGRYDEAARLAATGRELGDPQDASTQMLWRQVQALVLAQHGELEEAERLAREAVAVADATDGLNYQGHTRYDLADVLGAAGRTEDAGVIFTEALDRYERKMNLPLARLVRARIAELTAA
jgi:tetratricopeptide (TPR) repeat protein